jgi:predicted Ser/Thr protein kinase
MTEGKIEVYYEFIDGSPMVPKDNSDWAKINKEVMDIAKAMQSTGIKKMELKVPGVEKVLEDKKP